VGALTARLASVKPPGRIIRFSTSDSCFGVTGALSFANSLQLRNATPVSLAVAQAQAILKAQEFPVQFVLLWSLALLWHNSSSIIGIPIKDGGSSFERPPFLFCFSSTHFGIKEQNLELLELTNDHRTEKLNGILE
jgi:hypothetical protein